MTPENYNELISMLGGLGLVLIVALAVFVIARFARDRHCCLCELEHAHDVQATKHAGVEDA